MDQQTYSISFENVSPADASYYAQELSNILLDANSTITVHRERDDQHTQDFGATLVLLLGAPAVVALAKAVGDWLKLRHSISITIKKDGTVIAQNITSKEASRLIEILRNGKQEN